MPRRIARRGTEERRMQWSQEYKEKSNLENEARKGLRTKGSDGKTKGEGSPNSLKAEKRFRDQRHTRQRMSAKETERSGRNERENQRVIIITRHMTATKP